MRAINIKWDTNDEEWEDTITADIVDVLVDNLPTEVEIPNEIENEEDAISDYLSNVTGFCHEGYALEK